MLTLFLEQKVLARNANTFYGAACKGVKSGRLYSYLIFLGENVFHDMLDKVILVLYTSF